MFKKIVISVSVLLILGMNLAQAEVITFDDYSPLYTQYNDVPLVTNGFTFNGGMPGVWASQSDPPGAFNGTPHLIFYEDLPGITFGQTSGGSFYLNSLQLGLSWYTYVDYSQPATITLMLTSGDTSSMNVTLDHSFQTFNIGLDVTSVEIFSPSFTGAYFAMDNINVNAETKVPEPATMLLLGLGLIGLVGFRRKIQ